jgi:hypothetical protein
MFPYNVVVLRKLATLSLFVVSLLISGCGGGDSVAPIVPPDPPATTVGAVRALAADIKAAQGSESLLPYVVTTPESPTFFDNRLGLWALYEEEGDGLESVRRIKYYTDEQMTNPAGEVSSIVHTFPGGHGSISSSHVQIHAGPFAGANGSTEAHENDAQHADEGELHLDVPGLGEIEHVFGHNVETSYKLTKPDGSWSHFSAPMDEGTQWVRYESSSNLKIQLDRVGETNVLKGTITGDLDDLPAQIETVLGSGEWHVTWADGATSTLIVR